MRTFVAVTGLLLGACAFEPGSYDGDDGRGGMGMGGSGSGSGSGSDTGSGSGSGSGTIAARTCSFADPDLRLCIEFEDGRFNPMVSDASAKQLDVPATDVEASERTVSSIKFKAAGFWPHSNIRVPEQEELDISGPLSIELWVKPGVPSSEDLVENRDQYRVQVAGDGRIGCWLGNAQIYSFQSGDAEAQQWTHVGCTFDGANLAVYVDGRLAGSVPTSVAASTNGTDGTRIGSSSYYGFSGWLDDIRIYAKALSPSDMCQRATGQINCLAHEPDPPQQGQ